jgi:hypothetical protein
METFHFSTKRYYIQVKTKNDNYNIGMKTETIRSIIITHESHERIQFYNN